MPLLIAAFAALFAYLAHKNFRLAMSLFIFALPAYLIRFNIGPLPSTLLELNFAIIFLVWLIKYSRADWLNIKSFCAQNKFFTATLAIFFLSSLAGVIVSDMWWYSLGQWRAYFLEPIIFFLILLGRRDLVTSRDLILALAISTLAVSGVAIIQAITGALYPPSLWDDTISSRATSFFTSPNAVGLFLAPIFFVTLGWWYELKKSGGSRQLRLMLLGILGLAVLGLFASRSLGALTATLVGLLLFAYLVNYKKVALAGAVVAILLITIPLADSFLASKSQSLTNRLTLWGHTREFLTTSPKNFIFGAGIRQYFRKIEKPHYNPKELERLIYPHNIFLNFWSEIGLLGMLSFGALLYCLALSASRLLLNDRVCAAALLAALLSFAVHGIIDVPYFKNDLAMIFWIVAFLCITSTRSRPLPE